MMESTSSWTNLSGSKPNFFTAHGIIACRKDAPGMSACFVTHASRRAAQPLALGMPATPGGRSITRLHSDGELPEQEERLARLRGDPVGIAAAGVEVGDRLIERSLR